MYIRHMFRPGSEPISVRPSGGLQLSLHRCGPAGPNCPASTLWTVPIRPDYNRSKVTGIELSVTTADDAEGAEVVRKQVSWRNVLAIALAVEEVLREHKDQRAEDVASVVRDRILLRYEELPVNAPPSIADEPTVRCPLVCGHGVQCAHLDAHDSAHTTYDNCCSREIDQDLWRLPETDEEDAGLCPKCNSWVPGAHEMGVLYHQECSYCAHPSIDDGVCGICGERQYVSVSESTP